MRRLIETLRDKGLTLDLRDGVLFVEPAALLTPERLEWLKEKKAQLTMELMIEADEEYEANVRYCEGRIGFPPDELMGADYLAWLKQQDRPQTQESDNGERP